MWKVFKSVTLDLGQNNILWQGLNLKVYENLPNESPLNFRPKRKTLSYNETKDVLVKVAEDKATKSKKEIQDELDLIVEKLALLEGPSITGATVSF